MNRLPTIFFLLVLPAGPLCADTIFLKNGLRIADVSVVEMNHRALRFTQNALQASIDLREVRSVDFARRESDIDSVVLINGTTVTGTILSVQYDSVSVKTVQGGKTVSVSSQAIARVLGKQTYLPFRTADGTVFLLISRTVYFEAGKPMTPFHESKYRITLSGSASLPFVKTTFGPPERSLGYPLPGFGMTITFEQQLNERDVWLYCFSYGENSFITPTWMGSDFSAWKNAAAVTGFRRYFRYGSSGQTILFAEGTVGALFSTPPQNDRYVYDEAFTIAWGFGGGWFLTERTSISLGYTAALPRFIHTVRSPHMPRIDVQARISQLLLGLNYSIGNGN